MFHMLFHSMKDAPSERSGSLWIGLGKGSGELQTTSPASREDACILAEDACIPEEGACAPEEGAWVAVEEVTSKRTPLEMP